MSTNNPVVVVSSSTCDFDLRHDMAHPVTTGMFGLPLTSCRYGGMTRLIQVVQAF